MKSQSNYIEVHSPHYRKKTLCQAGICDYVFLQIFYYLRSREFEDLPNFTGGGYPAELHQHSSSSSVAGGVVHSPSLTGGVSSTHQQQLPPPNTSRIGMSIEAEDIRIALEKFGTIPKSSRIGAYLGK